VQVAAEQLAALTAPPTKEQLDQAQAAVDQAQQQLKLAQTPYTSHDIAQAEAGVQSAQAQLALVEQPNTPDDVKLAEAAVAQAQASLDAAKQQVLDGTISAPIDGVVSQKLLDVGAMATPASPIVTLISHQVEVDINVEEAKLGLIHPHQRATLLVSAYPGVPVAATVIGNPPTVDPKSRTALVRLQPVDPKGELKPGMYADVSVLVQPQQNVLLVPLTALVDDNGKTEVYLVHHGTVTVQPVSVGVQDANNAEITQGVSAGQTVVVGDKPSLATGDHVQPVSAGG
jgi:HlyD family secretion protein